MVTDRGRFVDENCVKEEALELLEKSKVDVIEFRGTGEPFLAKNLHDIATGLREICDLPFGIVTNGSMLEREDVQKELLDYDTIIIKLDAVDDIGLKYTNRVHSSILFAQIIDGIKRTIACAKADVVIQITFYRGNLGIAESLATLVKTLGPDRVFLSTPLNTEAPGLTKKEMSELLGLFDGLEIRTIFDE